MIVMIKFVVTAEDMNCFMLTSLAIGRLVSRFIRV